MTGDGAPIAVVGAGSWGTALALHLARIGHDVRLWARDPRLIDTLRAERQNPSYLPGVGLPATVAPQSALDTAVSGVRFVVLAVPSHGFRHVVRTMAPAVPGDAVVVSATKGIEEVSLRRMSEILEEEIGIDRPPVVLSGPTFAVEVARGLPTVAVAASRDPAAVASVQERFRGTAFRLYASDDVAGVETGGAMKNIIAIAAGVVEGLGLGHNAMAALITRGLAEISRLAAAAGGRRDTLAGLSGLGDLVLTCTGDLSRNRQVGIQLGRGRSLDDILRGTRMVAEGVRTTGAALALGERYGIELPITSQMAAVLAGHRSPREAVEALMGRRQRHEADE
jgi:glycerol-3-phosphate dehydrogenase (NAD(P)+)